MDKRSLALVLFVPGSSAAAPLCDIELSGKGKRSNQASAAAARYTFFSAANFSTSTIKAST
ncbi:MAG TPA: hypothetical protein VFQ03_09630, partial [Candidatus Binatia bacterium]|nr:hypothetical protein [Candidatus Binatia bacterium]